MIALLGATGRIGRYVAGGIAARGVEAVALVRGPLGRSATDLPVPARQADLTRPDSLVKALSGCDRLFLLTPHGPDQDLWESSAIRAAKDAGVTGIVKVSGSPASLGPNGVTSTAITHWRSERLIESEGFEFAHLRPSFMMQNLLTSTAPIVNSRGILIGPFSDEPIAMVDARDVAACATELLASEQLGDTAFNVSGPAAVTHRDIASILGVRSIRLPARFAGKALARKGEGAWEIDHAMRMISYFKSGADGATSGAVRSITGTAPRSINDFLSENAEAFGRSPETERHQS